ncbi:TPA: hypothetical protein DCX16_03035 [bacterium]|nr:hypothetical protein [bacterium]
MKRSILIADDDEVLCEWLGEIFKRERYNVFKAYTREDVIKLLKEKRFDVVTLDTETMYPYDAEMNVLEFIKDNIEPKPCVVVLSVNSDEYAEKFGDKYEFVYRYISKPCLPEELLKSIDNALIADQISGPFDLPSDTLVGELDFKKAYDRLYNMLFEKYGSQIDERFDETGARTIVIYKDNDKIRVAGISHSPYYPSADELRKIQAKVGKICYVVGRDIVEETSGWTYIPQIASNPYPTIPLYIGKADEKCKEIINDDKLLEADFDTGNPDILAFDDEYLIKILGQEVMSKVIQCRQFKRVYDPKIYRYYCYVNKVKIGLCDSKVKTKFCCADFDILFVLNWKNSPFVMASPDRIAFVGRALWAPEKLRFSLILNAKEPNNMFSQVEC